MTIKLQFWNAKSYVLPGMVNPFRQRVVSSVGFSTGYY